MYTDLSSIVWRSPLGRPVIHIYSFALYHLARPLVVDGPSAIGAWITCCSDISCSSFDNRLFAHHL